MTGLPANRLTGKLARTVGASILTNNPVGQLAGWPKKKGLPCDLFDMPRSRRSLALCLAGLTVLACAAQQLAPDRGRHPRAGPERSRVHRARCGRGADDPGAVTARSRVRNRIRARTGPIFPDGSDAPRRRGRIGGVAGRLAGGHRQETSRARVPTRRRGSGAHCERRRSRAARRLRRWRELRAHQCRRASLGVFPASRKARRVARRRFRAGRLLDVSQPQRLDRRGGARTLPTAQRPAGGSLRLHAPLRDGVGCACDRRGVARTADSRPRRHGPAQRRRTSCSS